MILRAAVVVLVLAVTAGAASADAAADAAGLRKTCVEAMNADPTFAGSIVQTAVTRGPGGINGFCKDVDTFDTHRQAVAAVEMNERHVIMAYAAMWVIAAAFLIYLLRRQQRLKAEIEQLRRELDAAAKGSA